MQAQRKLRRDARGLAANEAAPKAKAKAKAKGKGKAKAKAKSRPAVEETNMRYERAQDTENDSEAMDLEMEEEAEKEVIRAEPTKKRGRAAKKEGRDGDEKAFSASVKRRLCFDDLDEKEEAAEDLVAVCNSCICKCICLITFLTPVLAIVVVIIRTWSEPWMMAMQVPATEKMRRKAGSRRRRQRKGSLKS